MVTQSTDQENIVHWVGIDVAKATFQASFARPGQKWPATALRDLPTARFSRTLEGLDALMAWLGEKILAHTPEASIRVVMENTGKYSTELASWMDRLYPELGPAIVHAQQTHAYIKSMNLRSKTDAIEARALAFYGVEREPVPYVPLTPEQEQLRELVRHRDHLVSLNVAQGNRKEEGTTSSFVERSQQRMANAFQREIKKTEERIKKLTHKNSAMQKDIQLLTTIYGAGYLTAVTVLSEVGDLRRFTRARQLCAFAGLTPRHTQSGSSINKPAHLCKKGNARVRKALYMAALTAIRDKGTMQETYEQLIAKGKPKMVALGAVMRKLLTLMRALLISGKAYDPMWKTRQKATQGTAAA
jgi:transposase